MKDVSRSITILILLSVTGGVLKIYGSIVGGSKSVFVDAMTSIANTLTVIFILKFFKAGMEPPDTDHHYGHHRIAFGGVISMLMFYSFVAGLVVMDIVNSVGRRYSVDYDSPIYAILALIPYGVATYIARKSHAIVMSYAGFTAIELFESLVSILSSIGGVIISYLIDFTGAIALTFYLFLELVKNFKKIVEVVSDSISRDIVEKVFKIVENYGLTIHRIRLRKIVENIYHGDIIVKIPPSTSIEEAHNIIDIVEKELKKNGIDVTIHIEPQELQT